MLTQPTVAQPTGATGVLEGWGLQAGPKIPTYFLYELLGRCLSQNRRTDVGLGAIYVSD